MLMIDGIQPCWKCTLISLSSWYTHVDNVVFTAAAVFVVPQGGGMRGCVAAGMASCLHYLGLADSFDGVYGASAGSLVGENLSLVRFCTYILFLFVTGTAEEVMRPTL